MAQDLIRWVASDPKDLVRRVWPGEREHLVFVERTGDLHLLAPVPAAILECLCSADQTVDQLAVVAEQSPADVAAVVSSLAELGLIRPAAS